MAVRKCTDTHGLACLPLVHKVRVGRRTARIDAGRVRVDDAHTCYLPTYLAVYVVGTKIGICSSSLDSEETTTTTTDRTGTLPARQ